MRLEHVVLANAVRNEGYARAVLPCIKLEYFEDKRDALVFALLGNFVGRYNSLPSLEAMRIDLLNARGVGSDEFVSETASLLARLYEAPLDQNSDWLMDETERWCQHRALYNAIMTSADILGGRDEKKRPMSAVQDIVTDALSVSLRSRLGHDYVDDFRDRFESYTSTSKKFGTGLALLDRAMAGGAEPKTFNLLIAGCVHPDTPVRIRFRKRE